MSKHAAEPGLVQAHIELRRARIADALGRPLSAAGAGAAPLPTANADYLRREAVELYWNELSWEEMTDEERVSGGHLTELVFPGFLAFVDGLLVDRPWADRRPHPEVVEGLLLYLGERFAELSARLEAGADSERVVWARAMTDRLIDLVLYRLHRLTPEEVDALESDG